YHYYFQHPGFPVPNSVGKLAKGVDIRGEGGFVVAAGSPHKDGGKYWVDFDNDPQPAPEWLISWLRQQPAPVETQTYDGDVSGPERDRRRKLYEDFLKTTPKIRCEAHRGKGDNLLFDVVQYGAWDLALPTQDVLELIREHYDPRNDREWGDELEERVHHKSHC